MTFDWCSGIGRKKGFYLRQRSYADRRRLARSGTSVLYINALAPCRASIPFPQSKLAQIVSLLQHKAQPSSSSFFTGLSAEDLSHGLRSFPTTVRPMFSLLFWWV